jgi:hypothetical protein
MEKLGLCFTTWQAAQEAVLKVGQLLRIDLGELMIDGDPMIDVLEEFSEQLRRIKETLVDRDFVLLCDLLLYETTETNQRWEAVLGALRRVIGLS